jgi:hypothetical protein
MNNGSEKTIPSCFLIARSTLRTHIAQVMPVIGSSSLVSCDTKFVCISSKPKGYALYSLFALMAFYREIYSGKAAAGKFDMLSKGGYIVH